MRFEYSRYIIADVLTLFFLLRAADVLTIKPNNGTSWHLAWY